MSAIASIHRAQPDRPPSLVGRWWVINAGFAGFGWWLLLHRRDRSAAVRGAAERKFARLLESLGPVFVKLGQGLSVHRELLSDTLVHELERLQSHVGPFPGSVAERLIEEELGAPVGTLFAAFETTPFAAASMAQVHHAVMHDGRRVVVKVRRPHMAAIARRDLTLLRFAVRLVSLVVPGLRRHDPIGLLDELEEAIGQEVDFRAEAHNMRRFHAATRDVPGITSPSPVMEYCTTGVLVQTLSTGKRIGDASIHTPGHALAQRFVDAFLHQFFALGVFHADPHPGNVFVMTDGRLCFHDFGLVGHLDAAARRDLAAFMQAFVKLDADWLVDAAIDLELVSAAVDPARARRAFQIVLDDFAARPIEDWSFAAAFLSLARAVGHGSVRLPRHLAVLMRTVSLMEGTVRLLDPRFDLVHGLAGRSEQVVAALADTRPIDALTLRLRYESGLLLRGAPGLAAQILREVRSGRLKPAIRVDATSLGERLDSASERLAVALVALGLYIASSLLMQHSLGPMLGDLPALAMLGYGIAGWLTVRVVMPPGRGSSRTRT